MTSIVQSILLHFRFTGAYLNTMEGPDTIHGQLQVLYYTIYDEKN